MGDPRIELDSLRRDKADLEDQIKRLNSELDRAQRALGSDVPKLHEGDEVLPPWATNAPSLSPLLLAYDNRISELENALDHARRTAEELAESTKRLTKENLQLRDEMEQRWRELLEKQKRELDSGSVGWAFYSEEKNELQQRLDLLSNENSLLLEQLEAFKSRNEYLEQMAHEREELSDKLTVQMRALSTEYHNTKIAEEEYSAQKEIAEEKLKKLNEVLGTMERSREEAVTTISRLQNELRLAQQQSLHYRKAFEDLESKKTSEIEILLTENQTASLREKEALNKSAMQERELEDARETAGQYKRELDAIRSDCDNMLKIMEDYEQRLALYQQKEDSVATSIRESKQKSEAALLERDRALLREQQAVRQFEYLKEQAKKDLLDQKQKSDQLLESVRSKNKALLVSRDDELSSLQDKCSALTLSCERLQRDLNSATQDSRRARENLLEEQKRTQHRLDEYEKRMRDLEETRLTEKRVLESQSEHYSSERADWEVLKKSLEYSLSTTSRELDQVKSSSQRNLEENRRLHSQMEDLLSERDALVRELNAARDDLYEKLHAATNEYNSKVSTLERQITDAREKQQENEQKAYELLKARERVAERWKEEHHQTVGYFEKVVEELNDEIRRLQSRDLVPIRERVAI
jgi:chromosome segregation ATPase